MMKRDSLGFQLDEHALGPAIDASSAVDVFFLRVVEVMQLGKRHIVELKVSAVSQELARDLADPVSDSTSRGERAWQDVQVTCPPEGRVLRVEIEEREVSVLLGVESGKDGGVASRAVAEHGIEGLFSLENIVQERVLIENFPAQGVDEDEQRKLAQLKPFLACSES